MKNLIIKVLFSILLLSLPVAPTFALNLDNILGATLPFANKSFDNYYVKAQIHQKTMDQLGLDSLEFQIYQMKDQAVLTTTMPLHDGTLREFQLKLGTEDSFTTQPSLDLFLANYELKIIGVDKVANRDVFIIDIINKQTTQKTITYKIDQETSLVLSQFQYDNSENILHSFIVTEIDYNPEFSLIAFDDSPVIDLGVLLEEISQEHFSNHLPWLKLNDLALPHGYEIIGFANAQFKKTVLEEVYLTKGNSEIPVTNLYIFLSDGLRKIVIHVAYLDDHKPTTKYSIEVTETSPETYIMLSIPEAGTVISTNTSILTREGILALLKEFVPSN